MDWLYTFVLLAQQFIPGSFTVDLQTESYTTVLSGKMEEYKSFLGQQIELGWVDLRRLTITVPKKDLDEQLIEELECDDQNLCAVPVSAYTYNVSNESVRSYMQEKLLIQMGAMNAYSVKVLLCFKFAFPWDVDTCKSIPIEYLSDSEFLNRWVYRSSEKEGPNCFHSSLATAGYSCLAPQFISEHSFQSVLKKSFVELSKPQFADIAVLSTGETIEHAASFVGRDSDGKTIVFTKNGKVKGHYLFMKLEDLMTHRFAYPGTTVRFYSPIKTSSKEEI
jgi:hypothetical protein